MQPENQKEYRSINQSPDGHTDGMDADTGHCHLGNFQKNLKPHHIGNRDTQKPQQ
jgi:hypothetical protein